MYSKLISEITDLSGFSASLAAFFADMSISKAVMSIIVFFMLVGAFDKLRGNKLGYGEKFDEGFMAMGPLALAVVGIISIAPVLLSVFEPVVTVVYGFFGVSPAMFPATLLALDLGGYTLATKLAGDNAAIGQYAGLIVASTMGITISFQIPYALTLLKKEDHPILALGVLIGVVTLPIGCLAGGLAMNVTNTPIALSDLIINTMPVILLSAAVALGLSLKTEAAMKVFIGFGGIITFIVNVSPAIAVFQYLTGIHFPLFNKMVIPDENGVVPLEQGIMLVGLIAIVLIGAFPMVHFLNKVLGKYLVKLGRRLQINTEATTGLLTQLASSIPVFSVLDKMNDRGKLYNIAFAVSGSYVFGDCLGFVGGTNPEMTFPVITAKLVAGLLALLLAAKLPATKKYQ